jgi:uncharacterized membrane protein YoaK (UPF0700 family)
MALTAIAGFVDAHIYVHVVRVFVANMSGNVALFGIYVGLHRWPEVSAHLLSIAAFTVGVATGTVLHDRRQQAGKVLRPELALAAELVMLTGLLVLQVALGPTSTLGVDAVDYPILLLGALSMGLQTVVIGKVGSVSVSTTYESGAVARVGEEVALAVRRLTHTDRSRRHRRVAGLLAAVVVAYAGGAAVAAALDRSPAWLLVPLAGIAACIVPVRRVVRAESTAR